VTKSLVISTLVEELYACMKTVRLKPLIAVDGFVIKEWYATRDLKDACGARVNVMCKKIKVFILKQSQVLRIWWQGNST
jgi:hypothetical protein